ncbi:MAG: CAAX prenyl protease-related protein [bacterium]|nr:CAAX prenyl protease-related protein [bacterium]
MFSWINQGLTYARPPKRELMPLMPLLGYAKEHWVPYACHMLCISVLAKIIGPYYAYVLAVLVTACALLVFAARGKYPELTARGTTLTDWLLAVLVGIVGIIVWIAPYHFFPKLMLARIPILGNQHIYLSFTYGVELLGDGTVKATYQPFKELAPHLQVPFVIFRIFGAVVTVPFFEELFTRSFIIRFVEDEYYKRVPIGWYTKQSFVIALLFFVVAHPWWLVAVAWGLLIMWLLYYKKNLLLCVAAHAVSNAILAWYVLTFKAFYLW